MSDLNIEEGISFTIERPTPVSKEWRLKLFEQLYYVPYKDAQPNWFHRKMQELFFGVKWERSYDGGRTYRSS